IAYGLKQSGIDVTLFYNHQPNFIPSRYFSEMYQYRSPQEALSLASRCPSAVFHIFSNWDFNVAASFIYYKMGKVVFDNYDVMNGMIRQEKLNEKDLDKLQLERYCMENASGLSFRCLEAQYAKRNSGFRFNGKVLFLPDYCWDTREGAENVSENHSGQMHLVYCGNMSIEKIHGADDPFCFHLWLGDLLAKQGVHYHIYPSHTAWSGYFEDAFSEYITMSYKTPFFHIHHPVASDDLIKELAQYDFGVLILSRQIDGVEHFYNNQKYRYCIGNKIFDYLDSGLPVIIHNGKFSNFIASRYGTGITATEELLNDIIPTLKRALESGIKEKVNNARKAYSIQRHIPRLIKFYKSLL
ncbi:MAG: hypothetical protein PH343_01235, partial [Nitrospira sp.]|nr:hypothetical protein [Nitrospira sp.]